MADNKGTVIPFIKEKGTRDIIKKQFDKAAKGKDSFQESLNRINKTMAEMREIVRKSEVFLRDNASEYASKGIELSPPDSSAKETSTLDQEKLEQEYRRKQNEIRKRREKDNRLVTLSYQLPTKSNRDRDRDE